MFSFILLFIAVFLTTCVILWKRRRFYYASYKLKGPFAFPGIGNLLELVRNSEDIMSKFIRDREKYGCPFRLWFGTKLFVYTSNPEDFKVLLNSPYALNKKDIYVFYKALGKEGLFTCSDVFRWHRNRKIIAKTFSQWVLNSFIPVFQENSLILCEKLPEMVDKGGFDVYSWLARCHLDIIYETTTGVTVNAQQEESEYMKSFERSCDIAYNRVFNMLHYLDFIYKRTAARKEQAKLIHYVEDFNKRIIHSKQKQHVQKLQDKCSRKRKVFLDYLMESGQFSDDELVTELITITLAGTDTGSITEGFTLMLLGMHQEVQNKVFEEQQKIFGANEREITSTDLSEMKYLERVIKESLRLFPAAGLVFRTITNDIQLNSCLLPRGTTVAFGILDAHRHPSFWKDPLKFDPDRFLPGRIANKYPYSYIPFIVGPRDCIGQRYGIMVIKVVLSTIVRKYKIYCEYKNIEDIKISLNFTLKAKDGFKISLELRK